MTEPSTGERAVAAPESLRQLLGGRRGALDASLPPAAFVLGWLVSGRSIAWARARATAVLASVAAVVFRRVLRTSNVTFTP